jgi:protein MAK16
VWQAVLDQEKNGGKKLTDEELDLQDEETDEEDEEELEEEMEDEWGEREFVSDISEDEDDGLSDLEDVVVCFLNDCHIFGTKLCAQDEGSEEDEEPSGDEDEEDEGPKSKQSLGKRKAAPAPKPPRKRPDKKAKSMLPYYFELRSSKDLRPCLQGLVHGWKSSTSTKWRAYPYQNLPWQAGNIHQHLPVYYFGTHAHPSKAFPFIFIKHTRVIVSVNTACYKNPE